MISTIERLSPSKVAIHCEIDAESFEKAIQTAYLKQRGRIRVPGFRPGRAPRALIERMYGKDTFTDGALDELFPEAFSQTVIEHRLNVLEKPDVSVEQAESGKPLLFTATCVVYPQTDLKEYNDIDAQRPSDLVTDDAVDQEIERVRERNARVSEIDNRPCQDDDEVEIDYTGTVDGEEFDGGSNTDETLKLGSGTFIPGFEEQIVGMNVGDTREIHVTFPDDYTESLRGKNAVFEVKLNAIKVTELPELDDEFVKDVSEYDTLDEYRASVRAEIERNESERADNEWTNELFSALAERLDTEIPEIMIEREVDDRILDRVRGIFHDNMERVREYTERYREIPSFREQFREPAEQRLRIILALKELVRREGLEYDEEADAEMFDNVVQDAAHERGTDVDTMMKRIEEDSDFKDDIKDAVARRKAIERLRDIAKANASRHEGEAVPDAGESDE